MTRAAVALLVAASVAMVVASCELPKKSDQVQAQRMEQLAAEAASSVGVPAIKNFREMRLMKDVYELRDQDSLTTYTYLFSEQTGKLTFFCASVGYALPYATQFSNPEKTAWIGGTGTGAWGTMPQAEPNGLFMPSSAEGSWVMCLDPTTKSARAVYSEPRIVVSPFKLSEER